MDPRKGHKRINLGSANVQQTPTPLVKIDAIGKLETYLTYEKRYSPTSVKSVMAIAKMLFKNYDISKLTSETAYTIEADLRERKLSPRTIKHRLEAFELIAASRGISLKLKKPKLTKKERPSLSLAEARALMKAAENTRDAAIIQTLLCCGCRLKEIIALDVEDADLDKRLLHIRDRGEGIKNYHERKAVIPADCTKALKEWLNIRPHGAEPALFVNIHGCRLTRGGLYKIVRRTGERAGIDQNVFVHLCRHTMATLMLRSGVPITDVSLQLGHRNLSSTLVYLHGDISSLRESVDKKFKY